MCLVSYVPLGSKGFSLCSNRDEAPDRSTSTLIKETINSRRIAYPGDRAGGSWIFMSHLGEVVCILNGAFEIHKHLPPYKQSRGLMAKSFFRYANAIEFLRNFEFNGMEPFTFIIKTTNYFFEVRWDEVVLHVRTLDPLSTYVWSSSTLYTEEEQVEREEWYRTLLPKNPTSNAQIMDLHATGAAGNMHHGFVMNREDRVATISITGVEVNDHRRVMLHRDLSTGEDRKVKFV